MQSYLQYRRIGLAAKAQVERGHVKSGLDRLGEANAGGHTQPADSQQPSDLNASAVDDDTIDPSTSDSDDTIGAEARGPTPTGDLEKCYSEATALGRVLTGVHVRDRRASEGAGGQVFLVGWDGPEDRLNPRNWSVGKRVVVTVLISMIGVVVAVGSGIDATVIPQAAEELGVSEVAESLATAMFLVGIGLGSLVAGPFSETFGRNAVYAAALVLYMIWLMASALTPNFGAQLVFRLLAGCCGCTPMVCAGGSVADMWDSLEKTWSFPLFAGISFGATMLGPVIGAYIGPSEALSWRWVEWVTLIFSGLVLALVLVFMPETYGPLLLQWKAAHLRKVTGDARFRSEHEIVDATLLSRLKLSMTRPFLMATEPIVIAFSLYLSALYIVLFTFLIGWTYIFEKTYGISQGLSHIIFIAMFVGVLFVGPLIPFIYGKTRRAVERSAGGSDGGKGFSPEIRLWYAMLGPAVGVPISLFWMGWTDFPSVSIWSPICAAALFGFGVTGIFMCTYMYIIDSYEAYSASALTFVSLSRYLVAGGMTVVGIPFYENMGTHWTLTILGCISLIMAPIPYVLYFYGHWIRKRSRFAVSAL